MEHNENLNITNEKKSLTDQFNEVQNLWKKEKKLKAWRLLKEIEKSAELKNHEQYADSEVEQLWKENEDFINEVKEVGEEVSKLVDIALLDDDWIVAREVGDQKTLYKMDEEGYHLKLKGNLASPAFSIISCISEVDLWPLWMPFLKESNDLLYLSEFQRVIQMMLEFPIPIWPVISNRDLLFYAYGVDDWDDSGIALGIARDPKTIELQRWKRLNAYQDPPLDPNYKRIGVKYGGVFCKPIHSKLTEVIILANFQVNMRIPDFVISTVVNNFAHLFLDLLQKNASNLSEEYKKRISTNQTLYKTIIDRLKELDETMVPNEEELTVQQKSGWFW